MWERHSEPVATCLAFRIVLFELVRSVKCFGTRLALKGSKEFVRLIIFLSSPDPLMPPLVVLPVSDGRKWSDTKVTFIRLLARVSPSVVDQARLLGEGFVTSTLLAKKRKFRRSGPLVGESMYSGLLRKSLALRGLLLLAEALVLSLHMWKILVSWSEFEMIGKWFSLKTLGAFLL